MKERIDYLDSIKLIMCYLVMLAHYCIAYIPNSYIGYGSSYTELEKTSAFINGLPLSLFTNTSLELYIFFGLISMIATITFYSSATPKNFIKKQFIKRYFRFVIPISAAILLTYGLNKAAFLHFDSVYNISHSSWVFTSKPINISVWEALYIAFVKCFFVENTGILSIAWCMNIIFIGSLSTYSFLLILGNSKGRYIAYVIGALLFILFPKYAVFLAGIICGDFFVHPLEQIKIEGIKRELTALVILLSGVVIGIVPSIFIIPPFTLEYTYTIGTLLFLFGVMFSKKIQDILSWKALVSQAKYSFSFLLVQIPILYGISYLIFESIYAVTAHYILSFWGTFIICAAISHILAIMFYCLFEKPSAKLADYIYNQVSSKSFVFTKKVSIFPMRKHLFSNPESIE